MVAGAPNFSVQELTCPCGKCPTELPSMMILKPLQAIRLDYGKPLKVTAGIRCEEHNQALGGATRSRHIARYGGDAIDLSCRDSADRYRLVALAIKHGVKFIEVCPAHLHFDMRPGTFQLIPGQDK